MERGLAELAALQRTPQIDDSFKRLAPNSKLSFESHAWLITVDPATGAPLPPNHIAEKLFGLSQEQASQLLGTSSCICDIPFTLQSGSQVQGLGASCPSGKWMSGGSRGTGRAAT